MVATSNVQEASSFRHAVLGQLPATAICGNDITSSCLYVSALSIIAAGRLAPLALLIVAGVLYLFRSIYAEVVGALPLNGGAYNALLNTTSKSRASVAAGLTILSYMATAVISAYEAVHYTHFLHHQPVIPVTIGLLAVFMVLTILGITESAAVAIFIFITHLATLVLLLAVGGYWLLENGLGQLWDNFSAPLPESTDQSWLKALFFGFAAAMLGISGFESSANFVEEQKEGVFPKTLRNMWIAVSFFNPMMALLALCLVPIDSVQDNRETFLAHLGEVSGGKWLAYLVSVDATLVLSGAVLTSYVGVNGLVRRMTLDRCLPQFMLHTNRRGTTHRIIIMFFLLAVSVLLITEGEIEQLAGVYTLSFLAVMTLFGVGNVLLKVKRSRMPRPIKASWPGVIIGITAVVAGFIGNAVSDADEGYQKVRIFLLYFLPTMAVITIMLGRIDLLKVLLFFVRIISTTISGFMNRITNAIRGKIEEINSQQMVFFTRGDNVANLNNAMLYVLKNEHTNRIKVVTVVKSQADVPPKLHEEMEFLDKAYPDIDIEFVVIEGTFGPELIHRLSTEWNIPTNLMFIGSHGGRFRYDQAMLGGVRLII
ncbi:MAG: APC family permease [Planctomycetota bacterium]|nr:MAG: APC family permease [Planctomycetota bacterium]REJ95607.1 MAG: APC family permease [Planctomycetota bacterium]REK27855.1 MAG: APC family permease [Planctomycetota bacterium]REK32833.1 MAG: APC family permease [Planctomycetota bacterium]